MERKSLLSQPQRSLSFTPLQSGLFRRSLNSGSRAVAGTVPPIVHHVLASPGQSLEPRTRASMESRFKKDFSRVRIHTDALASASTRAVHASAYTVKDHIVFDRNHYAPNTVRGDRLLAHELVHHLQQAHAPTDQPLQLGNTNSPYENQADTISDDIATREPVTSPMLGNLNSKLDGIQGDDIATREPVTSPIASLPTPTLQRQSTRMEAMEEERRLTQPRTGPYSPIEPSPDISGGFRLNLDPDFRPRGGGISITGPELPIIGRPTAGLSLDPRGRVGFEIGSGGSTIPIQQIPQLLRPGGGAAPSPGTSTFPWPPRSPIVPTIPSPIGFPLGPSPVVSPVIPTPTLSAPRLRFGTIESSVINHFEVGSSSVPSTFANELDHIASLLNIYREVEVHIEGHTDTHGGDNLNQTLSLQRAEAVRAALLQRQVVNPDRIHVEAFGRSQPLFPQEASEEQRAGNRRVVIWWHIPPLPIGRPPATP